MTSAPSVYRGRLLDMPRHGAHCCGCATLAVSGDTFASVDAVPADGPNDLLLMSPFANAHDHVRGVRPISIGSFDLPLELWLTAMTNIPKVDPYLVATVGLGRQALGGVGSIMVHYTRPQDTNRIGEELEIVARVAKTIGVRVALAVAMRDRNPLGYGPDETFLDLLEPADRALVREKLIPAPVSPEEQMRFVDDLADKIESQLVTVQYGPYGLEWCSEPLLKLIARRSADNHRRVHMHLLESRIQREYLDRIYPRGPIRFLDEIGLLSPRLSVAHAVFLRPDEMELLAERGVTVSINASSNLSLRNGIPPVGEMQRRGLSLAIGLDGFSFDDDDDAFRELRLNYLLHKGTDLDEGLTVSSLLHATCYGGRRSVTGIEHGSGIAPGAPADLMVLDYSAISKDIVVDTDEASVLVHRGTSSILRELIVAGRNVAKDGKLAGVDLDAAQFELDAQVRHGASEFRSWREVSGRLGNKLRAFYTAGLHRCG
jgi:cytosine/adenosine deaminase-related metal-dependent hydrolase